MWFEIVSQLSPSLHLLAVAGVAVALAIVILWMALRNVEGSRPATAPETAVRPSEPVVEARAAQAGLQSVPKSRPERGTIAVAQAPMPLVTSVAEISIPATPDDINAGKREPLVQLVVTAHPVAAAQPVACAAAVAATMAAAEAARGRNRSQ